jgi:hypothetical protein
MKLKVLEKVDFGQSSLVIMGFSVYSSVITLALQLSRRPDHKLLA